MILPYGNNWSTGTEYLVFEATFQNIERKLQGVQKYVYLNYKC